MAILDVFKKEKEGGDKADKPVKKPRAVKKETAVVAKKADGEKTVARAEAHLLIKPYITEKATMLADGRNIYTFHIEPGANKGEIKKAIKSLYNVDALKIAIVNLPAKQVFSRGRSGVKSARKKALVYLKKGDTIEFA
jgi:large subunit ribosomal protein L23